jgi:Ca2+-binding RTX toxin-like protein
VAGNVEFVSGGYAAFDTDPDNGTVVLDIPEILNDTSTVVSGSINVKLWATASAYNGGTINGYVLATEPFTNVLPPGQDFAASAMAEPYTPPPNGSYHYVMTLDEYVGGQFYVDDYINLTTAPTPTPTPHPTPTPTPTHTGNSIDVTDITTGVTTTPALSPYSGPVAGLAGDFILVTSDNVNVTATTPNVFISLNGSSGEDAISVAEVNGNNVLNGSTGSSFLYGGSGNDTFFVDDRNPPAGSSIWSSVVGFHSGDNATVWGVTPNDFTLSWVDGQGAAGYTGLTLHASAAGKPTASLTLAGLTSADLSDGALTVTYGTTAAAGGVPGSNYMLIHHN